MSGNCQGNVREFWTDSNVATLYMIYLCYRLRCHPDINMCELVYWPSFNWWLVWATYVVDRRFFSHFFDCWRGQCEHTVIPIQLPYMVIKVQIGVGGLNIRKFEQFGKLQILIKVAGALAWHIGSPIWQPSWIITDRIWRMREGNVFSLSTPVGGGGVPWPGPARGGGYPSQVQPGVPPRPSQDKGRVPQLGGGTWGIPYQVRTGGYPPPPRTGQHMEYLIRRGRYASCVHAGGLSC